MTEAVAPDYEAPPHAANSEPIDSNEPTPLEERGVAILKVAHGQVLEVFGPGTQGRERTFPLIVAFEVEDVGAAREELFDMVWKSSVRLAPGTALSG